jgi:DNA-binding transcriptional LysR family regulator
MRYLVQLRTFVEAYRSHSLTRAAERLNITQPAASGHIKAIESLLGHPLFRRGPRGIAPTAAADELAALVGPDLDALEAKLASVQMRPASIAGSIHLAGPAEYLGEMIAPRLGPLLAQGVRVHAQTGNRDFIYATLAAGQADLAITASTPPGGFDHVVLAHEHLRLVVATRFADRLRGKRVTPALLRQLPLIAYDTELPLIREVAARAFAPAAAFEPAMVVPDLRGIAAMLRAGLGWSVLPDYLCAEDIRARRLLVLKLPRADLRNAIHLAWNRGALRHARTLFVRDFLVSTMQEAATVPRRHAT